MERILKKSSSIPSINYIQRCYEWVALRYAVGDEYGRGYWVWRRILEENIVLSSKSNYFNRF